MAQFPYILAGGFETGATNFDTAITDTTSKSAYSHYTDTSAKYGFTPWRGAYCWTIDQSKGTGTTAVYQTHAAFDVAAANYWSIGFAFYAKSTTMATGNRTSIVWANGTKEFCLQLYYTTAGGLQLLLTETAATAVGTVLCPLIEKQWHWIELYGVVDNGGSDNGTASLVVDGLLVGTVSSLNQAAFTDLYVGLEDIDAGHTAGIYAFDDILISGTDGTSQVRIGHRAQFPTNVHVSSRSNALDTTGYAEHLFLGPGTVSEVVLLTAYDGDAIRLYDTDRAYYTGDYNLVAECNFSSGMPVISGPITFTRGCLCIVIPGSINGARGMVKIDMAPDCGNPKALYYGFPQNLLRYALVGRTELLGNR